MGNDDLNLMAHLLRRAGFGATRPELARYSRQRDEATLEELLSPVEHRRMGDVLIRQYHQEQSGLMGQDGRGSNWL